MPDPIRFVVEGDSWARLPALMNTGKFPGMGNHDISRSLIKKGHIITTSDKPIAEWGDTLKDIARERQYLEPLSQTSPDIFLLNGGGNDLLGNGFLMFALKMFKAEFSPQEYLGARFFSRYEEIMGYYRTILDDVRSHAELEKLPVVLHGYHYAIPRNFGQWIGVPMNWKLINYWEHDLLRRQIVIEMIDRLYSGLAQIASEYDEVFVADLRKVQNITWHDEIHPDAAGFDLVTDEIIKTANLALVQAPDTPIV